MKVLFTIKEISEIVRLRKGIPGLTYYDVKGNIYQGQKGGSLRLITNTQEETVKVATNVVVEAITSPTTPVVVSKSATVISKYTAGETLGGHRVVMLQDGKAFYFNAANENNQGRLLGVTTQAALTNSTVDVATDGVLINTGWGLTANSIYYAGANGGVTTAIPTPPSVLQSIGIAVDANSLKLKFSEPISII